MGHLRRRVESNHNARPLHPRRGVMMQVREFYAISSFCPTSADGLQKVRCARVVVIAPDPLQHPAAHSDLHVNVNLQANPCNLIVSRLLQR